MQQHGEEKRGSGVHGMGVTSEEKAEAAMSVQHLEGK